MQRRILQVWCLAFAGVLGLLGGCAHTRRGAAPADAPTELAKLSLPEYVVEPPDILRIDALQLVPLPPYRIQSLDILAIRVPGAPAEDPIAGHYTVEPEGTVNLGLTYGPVAVVGKTMGEARAAIEAHLARILKKPQVDLAVAQGRAVQQVRGEHLVRPDGAVSLGSYGAVRVAGLPLSAVKAAIEQHLSRFLQNPEVSVDVAAYNSKVYYVIFDQGGNGQRIYRLPITGNETVLDAFSQVSGLSVVSDEKKMWVSRPSRCEEPAKVLPVDWKAITMDGRADTNYQLLPGDRIFVKAYPMTTFDTGLARVLAPFERMMGFSLLGAATVQTLQFDGNNGVGGLGVSP